MNDVEQLPRADEAERGYLGAVLRYPDRANELLPLVEPRDLFDTFHQQALAVLKTQYRNGGIDVQRVRRELKVPESSRGDLAKDYFNDLIDDTSTSSLAPVYAEQIIECRRKRDRFDHHYTMMKYALNGYTSERIDQESKAAIYDWEREREATEPQWLFTAGELVDQYPALNPPVIDGIARQGETVNLISGTKAGKSWLLDYIMLCITDGREVFERFATWRGKCLVIDNELHRPTIASRLHTVAYAMGLTLDDYRDHLEIWPCRGLGIDLPEVERRLLDTEPGKYRAIGFDAMYRFVPNGVSENDNSAMKEIYNRLDRIAEHTQAANLIIHHGSKGNQSEKRVTDVGAGAGAQSRAADAHLIIREHEQDDVAVLEAALRSFAPVQPMALRWCFPLWLPADDIDPGKLRGKQTRTEARQGDRDREGVNAIIDALRKGGAATARQLRSKTLLSRERQQRLLDTLTANGDIVSTEIEIRGNKTNEYSLPKSDE